VKTPEQASKPKANRSTLELAPQLVAELNEFALNNRIVSRADAIRYLLRFALSQSPSLPKPPFLGARIHIDAMGNVVGWSGDL
jgi:hypothetical protein